MKYLIQFRTKKHIFFAALFSVFVFSATAQLQTQVVGDSVFVHSNNGTGELILENSTKEVNGFLFNRNGGRTEFRKGLITLSDTTYLIGSDTLHMNKVLGNAWNLFGNAGTNPSVNFIGTKDSTKFIIKTNNQQRASIWQDGTINFGLTDTSSKPLLRLYPNGDLTLLSRRSLSDNTFGPHNGLRYTAKYGILEIGTTNNFDTTIGVACCGSQVKSAIVINSDFLNNFKGNLHGSIVGGNNMVMKDIMWSAVFGETHRMGDSGMINKSVIAGWGLKINKEVSGSLVAGNNNLINGSLKNSIFNGYSNTIQDSIESSIISGISNKAGSSGQLVSGLSHIAKSPYGTFLGNKSVDFSSLDYTGGLKGLNNLESLPNLEKFPLLSLGNSKYYITGGKASYRSNALTIVYSGRTQINTTGYNNNLVEADVVPKAALEVVSNNSGVLLPKLTTAQRDAILAADLHVGLLIFNTDVNGFQYFGGVGWKTISENDEQINGTSVFDFPSTTSASSSDINVTVVGAQDGDIVSLGIPGISVNANSCFTAWVSAPDTVTVRFNNYSNSAIDPAAGTFKIKVNK